MTVAGKRVGITREDLLSVASEQGILRPGEILQEVRDAVLDFAAVASSVGIRQANIRRITSDSSQNLHDGGF